MLYVEKTTPEDCFELAKNLKQVDKYELAIWGLDPLQALLQPFRYTKRKVHTYMYHILLYPSLYLKLQT